MSDLDTVYKYAKELHKMLVKHDESFLDLHIFPADGSGRLELVDFSGEYVVEREEIASFSSIKEGARVLAQMVGE